MKKANVGVIVAVVIGVMLLFSGSANAFTLSWDPVTQYADNTAIGSEAGGVFYNVEMDGTVRASKISATSWVLPAVPKKSSHTFRAQSVLGTGEVSAWTPPFAWTSPPGVPVVPSGLTVQP
jgi:hypothetical protein